MTSISSDISKKGHIMYIMLREFNSRYIKCTLLDGRITLPVPHILSRDII